MKYRGGIRKCQISTKPSPLVWLHPCGTARKNTFHMLRGTFTVLSQPLMRVGASATKQVT